MPSLNDLVNLPIYYEKLLASRFKQRDFECFFIQIKGGYGVKSEFNSLKKR